MSYSGTEQNVLFYFNSVITIVIVVLVVILILTEKSRGPERGPEGGPERGPEGGSRKGGPRFVYTLLNRNDYSGHQSIPWRETHVLPTKLDRW